MMSRLRSEGLVVVGENRELDLTTSGRAVADAIFRRHALVEWLLTGVVGLGWAESDREAHHLQAAISENVETRLFEFLGRPETCPHGNPIDLASAKAPACRRPAQLTGSGRPGNDLSHHGRGRGGRRPAVLPRGPRSPTRRGDQRPGQQRVARCDHRRGTARFGHLRTPSRAPDPGSSRDGRPTAVPRPAGEPALDVGVLFRDTGSLTTGYQARLTIRQSAASLNACSRLS